MAKHLYSGGAPSWEGVARLAREIANEAGRLVKNRIEDIDMSISYCAIFCQELPEYDLFKAITAKAGILANDTSTGPVFIVPAIETNFGPLRILKVRTHSSYPPVEEHGNVLQVLKASPGGSGRNNLWH